MNDLFYKLWKTIIWIPKLWWYHKEQPWGAASEDRHLDNKNVHSVSMVWMRVVLWFPSQIISQEFPWACLEFWFFSLKTKTKSLLVSWWKKFISSLRHLEIVIILTNDNGLKTLHNIKRLKSWVRTPSWP